MDDLKTKIAEAIEALPDGPYAHEWAAQAALQAIHDAGFAVVPREPSYEMVRAASESAAHDDEGPYEPLCDIIDCSGEDKTHTIIREALRCAIQAHQPKTGEGT